MIGVENSSALQWAPTSNFYGKIIVDSFNQEHIFAICKKNESGDAYRDLMQLAFYILFSRGIFLPLPTFLSFKNWDKNNNFRSGTAPVGGF